MDHVEPDEDFLSGPCLLPERAAAVERARHRQADPERHGPKVRGTKAQRARARAYATDLYLAGQSVPYIASRIAYSERQTYRLLKEAGVRGGSAG